MIEDAISWWTRACSAPQESSHELGLAVTELGWAEVLRGLVRPMAIVPVDPSEDGMSDWAKSVKLCSGVCRG